LKYPARAAYVFRPRTKPIAKPPVSCKSSLLDDVLTRFLDDGPINPAATASPLTIAAQIASDVPA